MIYGYYHKITQYNIEKVRWILTKAFRSFFAKIDFEVICRLYIVKVWKFWLIDAPFLPPWTWWRFFFS